MACRCPINLNDLSDDQIAEWIDSFDHVLLDCDGVVLSGPNLLPGVKEGIDSLKRLGKSVHIITNNCTRSIADWQNTFEKLSVDLSGEDVVFPGRVAADYLKKKKGEVFVLGPEKMRQHFRDEGLKLYEYVEDKRDEIWASLDALKADDGHTIGSVVVDLDPDMTYLKLMKACMVASKPDVQMIFTGTDKSLGYGDISVIGPYFFQEPLQFLTQKKPIRVGKPSTLARDYLQKQYNIKPSRTLFIGDSLYTDMTFASQCCFKKMLVLSGITTKEQLDNCQGSLRPTWYLEGLGDLEQLLANE